MFRILVIVGVTVFVGVIAAAIIPMWVATADMAMPIGGWAAVVGTVVFCFGLGGALMFLVFYSAHHGHDEEGQSHADQNRLPPDGPAESP